MKKIIKMNDNNNYLSLGNFCRLVKEISPNKSIANQTDIFCTIFELESSNDSTVNNYCLGYRPIGKQYKEIIKKKKDNYQKDKNIMLNIIMNINSIINGFYYSNKNNTIDTINKSKNMKQLCINLYNIAKNDTNINSIYTNKISTYLEKNNLYECISELIFYIILEHKQPIYLENIIKTTIEELINDTNISLNDLASFLKLQMIEGNNYIYSLKKLAKEKNAYATFELGRLEYLGRINGTKRYQKSYEYFKTAADSKHPRANYFIAKMLLEENIGTKSREDINIALEYALTSKNLGNIAANNLIGLIYLNYKNNPKEAIKHFEIASQNNYPYAYNNLGKLKEKEKKYQEAFNYYLKSAELEESWACNKVAEYYRQGIGTTKNLNKAFHYYNLSLESTNNTSWPKYNLATYFYLNGNYEINLEKDENKAITLLEESASSNNIKAITFLIEYYTKKYFKERNKVIKEKVNKYIKLLEKHPNYNHSYKTLIEKYIKELKEKEEIDKNLDSIINSVSE